MLLPQGSFGEGECTSHQETGLQYAQLLLGHLAALHELSLGSYELYVLQQRRGEELAGGEKEQWAMT